MYKQDHFRKIKSQDQASTADNNPGNLKITEKCAQPPRVFVVVSVSVVVSTPFRSSEIHTLWRRSVGRGNIIEGRAADINSNYCTHGRLVDCRPAGCRRVTTLRGPRARPTSSPHPPANITEQPTCDVIAPQLL